MEIFSEEGFLQWSMLNAANFAKTSDLYGISIRNGFSVIFMTCFDDGRTFDGDTFRWGEDDIRFQFKKIVVLIYHVWEF